MGCEHHLEAAAGRHRRTPLGRWRPCRLRHGSRTSATATHLRAMNAYTKLVNHVPPRRDAWPSVLICVLRIVVLKEYPTGTTRLLHLCCSGTVLLLLLCCCRAGDVLMRCWYCCGDALACHCYETLVLHWCCAGVALVLHWRCTRNHLVRERHQCSASIVRAQRQYSTHADRAWPDFAKTNRPAFREVAKPTFQNKY